jgi:two-component system NarL family sensor kinase
MRYVKQAIKMMLMKLRRKIIVFATAPLVLALCIMALTVQYQATTLAKMQNEVIQKPYLASKEAELKSYVDLAKHAIAPIYESGRKDIAAMDEAKAVLARLDYGGDGYFFVYDLEGKLLVHPRRPYLVGENRLDYRDLNGFPTIQQLISTAQQGGGFVTYATEKPSTKVHVRKLTYVIPLPNWGWVLGTGIYLDDVDEVLTDLDAQIWNNNFYTMCWIGAIAFLGVAIVIASGLVLNIRERRSTLEEERARVAREFHGDICQRLLSNRLQAEGGLLQMAGIPERYASAQSKFENVVAELNNIMGDIRQIAHDLYPGKTGSGNGSRLIAILRQLAQDMSSTAISVDFTSACKEEDLPEHINKPLYEVAQDALTNVVKHSGGSHACMHLEADKYRAVLTISDNGRGFDPDRINSDPTFGMGLRNMESRLKDVRGNRQISSTSSGTTIIATIPLSFWHYFWSKLKS